MTVTQFIINNRNTCFYCDCDRNFQTINPYLILVVHIVVPLNYTYFIVCIFLRHEAERLEQEAKGRLERQKITDEAEAERARKELLELQAQSAAVESTGQAKAEAQSRAEAARIEGEAAVQQAKLKAEAAKIEAVSLFNDVTT